jgi:hypothetical protein
MIIQLKKLKLAGLLASTSILIYCSSYSYIPTPAEVKRAQEKWPDVDSATLFKGYTNYKDNCGECHFLYKPEQYTLDEWESILPKMKQKANLSEEDIGLIKKYIYVRLGN